MVQDDLAESLGVSRVPIREALKVLEGEGQVTYIPRRGYFVAELSIDNLIEVYRIRSLLESEAIRSRLFRCSIDESLQRLSDLLAEVEAPAGQATSLR